MQTIRKGPLFGIIPCSHSAEGRRVVVPFNQHQCRRFPCVTKTPRDNQMSEEKKCNSLAFSHTPVQSRCFPSPVFLPLLCSIWLVTLPQCYLQTAALAVTAKVWKTQDPVSNAAEEWSLIKCQVVSDVSNRFRNINILPYKCFRDLWATAFLIHPFIIHLQLIPVGLEPSLASTGQQEGRQATQLTSLLERANTRKNSINSQGGFCVCVCNLFQNQNKGFPNSHSFLTSLA